MEKRTVAADRSAGWALMASAATLAVIPIVANPCRIGRPSPMAAATDGST